MNRKKLKVYKRKFRRSFQSEEAWCVYYDGLLQEFSSWQEAMTYADEWSKTFKTLELE